jgi:hypothetical protein
VLARFAGRGIEPGKGARRVLAVVVGSIVRSSMALFFLLRV